MTNPVRLVVPGGGGFRYPGQVPTREILEAQRAATARPEPQTLATMLEPDPILRPGAVAEGLGLSMEVERDWGQFLAKAVQSCPNEAVLRRMVVDKSRGIEDAARSVLLKRAVRFWRTVRKSVTEIVTLQKSEPLEKAEARGGKYHRRVPLPGGGFRYIYDEEKYAQRKDAHISGPEAEHSRVMGKIAKAIEQAGPKGLHISALKSLVQTYGADKVIRAIRAHLDKGGVTYAKSRFTSKPRSE